MCTVAATQESLSSIKQISTFFYFYNNKTKLNIFSFIPPQKIRVIKKDPVISNNRKEFNRQILGAELAQLLDWQTLVLIKAKYLFSKELSIELKRVFKKIEHKFYTKGYSRFSSGEKFLISFMQAIASWDKEVSILLIDECTADLDKKIKDLFFKCLSMLSTHTALYLITGELFNIDRPAKINLKIVN